MNLSFTCTLYIHSLRSSLGYYEKSSIRFTDKAVCFRVLETILVTLGQELWCKVIKRVSCHDRSPKIESSLSFITDSWRVSINRKDHGKKERDDQNVLVRGKRRYS